MASTPLSVVKKIFDNAIATITARKQSEVILSRMTAVHDFLSDPESDFGSDDPEEVTKKLIKMMYGEGQEEKQASARQRAWQRVVYAVNEGEFWERFEQIMADYERDISE